MSSIPGATRADADGRPAAVGRRELWAGLIAVSLMALNLRTAVVAVSPLLSSIQSSLGLSSAVAGLLTTVPDICFGAFALLAPALSRRIGLETTLAGGLALLSAGSLLRLAPGVAPLFGGTLLAGVGAALGNVLLPALVKRDFSGQVGLLTGVYTMVLSAGAALAAGAAVPLQRSLGGWRPSLALWAAPAAIALAVALARQRPASRPAGSRVRPSVLAREPVAWAITIAMGMQSFIYYALLAWMPTVFEQHGASTAEAGLLLSLNGIVSIPTALAAPMLAGRLADQRPIMLAGAVLTAAGLIGLALAPGMVQALWAVVLGVGTSVTFALTLTLFGLRSANAEVAGGLSAMAQGYGYLFAAGGPFLVGLLHDTLGGWRLPLLVVLALVVPFVAAGWRAARPGVIDPVARS